ncbi:MAG: ATP-binding protein [Candidatus Caldarchaeum sp.]
MLFDPRPKDSRENLFGRDEELEKLLSAFVSGPPLILVLGMRRLGKTSLLKVALNEYRGPYIYLDLRIFAEEGFSKVAFYRLLSEELSRVVSRWRKLKDFIAKVRGVEVAGVKVELDWGRSGVSLSSLFRAIDNAMKKENRNFVVAFDEAQLLRFVRGGKGRIDFRSFLAYAYDNLRHVKFVLTGSEVGLLMDFIGAYDSSSPLYGRYREEIVLKKFDQTASLDFLRQGFQEYGMRPDKAVLEKVVDVLDGVVGWLTYYGYEAVSRWRADGEVLDKVVEEAVQITRNELEKIFTRSPLYRDVVRAVAKGSSKWNEIKQVVEAWRKVPVSNAHLSRILKGLVKLNVLEKRADGYFLADPLTAVAVSS